MYDMNPNRPYPIEKIIAILSYLTGGFIGFLWIIIAVLTKNNLRLFLRYHVYQSIFLSLVFFIFSIFLRQLSYLLSYIPIIKNFVGQIQYFLSVGVIYHYSIIDIFILLVILSLIIGVLRNQYSYIPWVSDVIKYNLGR